MGSTVTQAVLYYFFISQSRKKAYYHPYSLPYSLKAELGTRSRLPLSSPFAVDFIQSTPTQPAFNITAFLSLPISMSMDTQLSVHLNFNYIPILFRVKPNFLVQYSMPFTI